MTFKLSDKHGLNASIEQCFYCLEPKGVVMFGQMKDDFEAPPKMVLNHEPCARCARYMEQGVICIRIRDGEAQRVGNDNPYRTGRWCVLKEEAVKRILDKMPELCENVLRKRVMFIEDSIWAHLDLDQTRGATASAVTGEIKGMTKQ